MKLIINNNNNKTTIIFIHGLKKNYNDWNITEHNKEINIEKTISKICNTVLVQLEDDDYKMRVIDVVKNIYDHLQSLIHTNFTIITHSIGSFYGMSLVINHNIFTKLIMLDPTIKSIHYLEGIKKRLDKNPNNIPDVMEMLINNYDMLPTFDQISKKVIVRVHLNMKSSKDTNVFFNRIICLDKLIKQNMKSRLCLHVDVSHMIHYKIPHVIIDSIKDVYKL